MFVRRAMEQVEPMLVDAAKIAPPKCDAMTVEEFEHLNRDLAAIVKPVAKLRRSELSVRSLGSEIGGNLHHLRNGAAQKEMIVSDFIDLA